MPRVKVKLNSAGVVDIFEQWAARDGARRADRVAAQGRATAPVVSGTYRDSIRVSRETHGRGRPVFHVGPSVDYGMKVEAATGNMARALDAAGGA